MERDCNTCKHHRQGQHPDYFCQGCLSHNLRDWEPMSKAYDEAFRDEKDCLCGPRLPVNQSALDIQVGGGHYKEMKIQPIEFATANKLDFFQLNIVKYSTRKKGDKAKRIEDLNKAKHYLDLYIEAIEKGEWE